MAKRLCQSEDSQLNVRVPVQLAEKLDRLREAAEEHGVGAVSRKELVAALIHRAPDRREELAEAIMEYRRAPANP